jgi:hypothetical protein
MNTPYTRINNGYKSIFAILSPKSQFNLNFLEKSNVFEIEKDVASKFIENLILNIFFTTFYTEENSDGIQTFFEGEKEIRVFNEFINCNEKLSNLKILTSLNGKTFSELDGISQSTIEDYKIRIINVQPPTEKTILSSIKTSLIT